MRMGGFPVGEICRKLGISEPTFYRWKKQYGDLGLSELRELRQLAITIEFGDKLVVDPVVR